MREKQDMCVPCGDGIVNIRVGAVIARDGKFLMAGNDRNDYLYSVGGRVKMDETAEEAIVREVFEETGVQMTVDRLAFVHENCYLSDMPGKDGKDVYELCFYFMMNVPPNFAPRNEHLADGGIREFLVWVAPDDPRTIYPDFFRTEALSPRPGVTFFSTDERKKRIYKKEIPYVKP